MAAYTMAPFVVSLKVASTVGRQSWQMDNVALTTTWLCVPLIQNASLQKSTSYSVGRVALKRDTLNAPAHNASSVSPSVSRVAPCVRVSSGRASLSTNTPASLATRSQPANKPLAKIDTLPLATRAYAGPESLNVCQHHQ